MPDFDREWVLGSMNTWRQPLDALEPDEHALAALAAVRTGKGYLLLTDRRVWFGGSDGTIEIPLAHLGETAVDWPSWDRLVLRGLGGPYEFDVRQASEASSDAFTGQLVQLLARP